MAGKQQVAVVELTGGGRPPLHRHDFDETFYVLEGELTFQLVDDLFARRAGELAFVPVRPAAHLRQPERCSGTRAPGHHPVGFERYFDRIAARISGERAAARGVEANPGGDHGWPAARRRPDMIRIGASR